MPCNFDCITMALYTVHKGIHAQDRPTPKEETNIKLDEYFISN